MSARSRFGKRRGGNGGGGKRARNGGGGRRVVRRGRARNIRTAGFLGIENKFVDAELAATAFATTWTTLNPTTFDALPIPAIGNTESTRIGRIYSINSIHIKGQLAITAQESVAAPVSDARCRVCVVWDTQTNGAEMTATDAMDGGQAQDTLSFRNLQFSKRFKILYDRTFIFHRTGQMNEGAANLFAAPIQFMKWNFNKRFKNPVKVICSGTTGVVGSVTDNSFHVITVASSTAPTIEYQARVRFVG